MVRGPKAGGTRLPKGISLQDGYYRVRLFVNGVQHSLGMYKTLTDARAALDIARGQKARGTFVPPPERRRRIRAQQEQVANMMLTVEEWSTQWLNDLRAQRKSPGTITAHSSLLRVHILPVIGTMPLAVVTEDDINDLVAGVKALPSKRHKGAETNGVWANVARTLRAMFNAAIAAKVGGITESPVHVSVPKGVRVEEVEDDTDVATPAEVRSFTDAMPARLAIAVPLAAWCALRLGEVLGLQRRDLVGLDEPGKARLYVRRQWNTKASPARYTDPKAGSARSVSIPASLVPDIVAHLDQYVDPGPDAPVVTAQRYRDRPCSQTVFDKAWRTAREGVRPGFRFHALRHTGMTLYGQQGATTKELMDRAGHRSPDMVLRYQHSTKDRDRAMTDRLDDVVRAARAASAGSGEGDE
jgi:integrase